MYWRVVINYNMLEMFYDMNFFLFYSSWTVEMQAVDSKYLGFKKKVLLL